MHDSTALSRPHTIWLQGLLLDNFILCILTVYISLGWFYWNISESQTFTFPSELIPIISPDIATGPNSSRIFWKPTIAYLRMKIADAIVWL